MLSYLSLYLMAGRSFDVKGGSYFEKAENIFKPSMPPNSSSLFRNDPTSFSLAPYKFYILWMWLPPPLPAYSSYKSCWGSLCSTFLNKMMTAKSCCFTQDKNIDINKQNSKEKSNLRFPDISEVVCEIDLHLWPWRVFCTCQISCFTLICTRSAGFTWWFKP